VLSRLSSIPAITLLADIMGIKNMFEELTPELMQALRMQRPQARAASSGTVTCICNKDVELMAAYRCLHCGIWFCRECGEEHFGPDAQPIC